MNNSIAAPTALIALAALATSADIINEDFESSEVGSFPGGIWHDVFERVEDNPTPAPTMSVIETTDAHGNPTRALQTNRTNGTNGFFAEIDHAATHTVSMDVRVDALANPGQGWPAGVGFVKDIGLGDINRNPQGLIYGWTDRRFYLFISQGVDRPAINVPLTGSRFTVGEWYTLTVTVDTETGAFEAAVTNAADGSVLSQRSLTVANWDAERGSYDAITMFDGEVPGSTSEGQSTIDNVSYVPAPGATGLALGAAAMLGASRRRR